ncbi:MBOAT family O-acyltransferase [Chryseomicrobium sp. FSL W7-1435]|uniref:MBOAT family O-acyltransferase n=1 Tax=Chryseomicrobium sp. FSL W7-1435 TaxID=2921704 RepID=UPI003159AB66
MLFNSFEFIFVFLPIVFIGYFLVNKIHHTAGIVLLLLSSLFFYAWWNPAYLLLLIVSILVNYGVGTWMMRTEAMKKQILILGIIFNVLLLGYFKYTDFFIANFNHVLNTNFQLLHLLLPLAISFYTFQQIAYLVDRYKGKVEDNNFLNYALFISFFPQLIAGPIVHHKEVMGQYLDAAKKKMHAENIAKGLFIFSIGLFKKVAIADTFAVWANEGYSNVQALTTSEAWVTSLAYTFQLYFDFSGYSDMAIGLALLFNIVLPLNFNSPYRAVSIQDFWRRWHMTLSRFLTDYLYIPLGGSYKSIPRTYVNIFIIFFVSGIWHGAGWTFVIWGVLHGLAMIVHRFWHQKGFKLPAIVGWIITFQFVNATWVFFRALTVDDALIVLGKMAAIQDLVQPLETFSATSLELILYFVGAGIIAFFFKNSYDWMQGLRPNPMYAIAAGAMFLYVALKLQQVSEFLYFNF